MKEIIIESLKELLRVSFLSVIPLTIDMLMNNSLNYQLLAITGAVAFLRGLDKLLHEYGKSVESSTGQVSNFTKGITRF